MKVNHIVKHLLISLCALSAGAWAQRLPSIAVLDFERTSDISEAQAAVLSDQIRLELIQMRLYSVIERGQLNMILQEQSMQTSGICNSNECAVQIGQMIGADEVITGSVGKFGSLWVLNLRRIDVGTGQILKMARTQTSGSIEILLTKGVPEVVTNLHKDETTPNAQTNKTDSAVYMNLYLTTPFASVAEGMIGVRYSIGIGKFSLSIGYGLLGLLTSYGVETPLIPLKATIYPMLGISFRNGLHEFSLIHDYVSFGDKYDGGHTQILQFQYHRDLGEPGGWGLFAGGGIAYMTTTIWDSYYDVDKKEYYNAKEEEYAEALMFNLGFSYQLMDWHSGK